MNLRAAALAVLAATLLPAVPGPAVAADAAPTTWGITPSAADGPDGRPAFTYIAEPSERYDDHLAVRNFGTEPLRVRLYASDATNAPDGSFTVLARDEKSTDAGSWVTLERTRVVVPARSNVVVPFSISVPADAEPGDHAAGVLASVTTPGGKGSSVAVERRAGTRIYLRVAGPISPELTVEDLRASYDGSWNPFNKGTTTVSYTLRNTGNLRLDAGSRATAAGPFGLLSAGVELPDVSELLPGSSVEAATEVTGAWPLARMGMEVTATPTGSAGDDLGALATPATSTVSYWAFHPVWTILLIALLLLVLTWWLRRRRTRRSAADAESAHLYTDFPPSRR